MKNLHSPLVSLLTFVLIISSGCDVSQDEEKKHLKERQKIFKKFEAERDSVKANELIEKGDLLELPAIKNWDAAVRLRGASSWGEYDFICTIYKGDPNRIQLINKDPGIYNQFYTYRERVLSDLEFDMIMDQINECGIEKMPQDLEPEFEGIDGGEYSVLVKKKHSFEYIYWQEMEIFSNEFKEKVIPVFEDIIIKSGFPKPRFFIEKYEIYPDSTKYRAYPDYDGMPKKLVIRHKEKRLGEPIRGCYFFTVSNNDTAHVAKDLLVEWKLRNGETIELDEKKVFNYLINERANSIH